MTRGSRVEVPADGVGLRVDATLRFIRRRRLRSASSLIKFVAPPFACAAGVVTSCECSFGDRLRLAVEELLVWAFDGEVVGGFEVRWWRATGCGCLRVGISLWRS